MKFLSLNEINQVNGGVNKIEDLESYKETIALALMVAAVIIDPKVIGRIKPLLPILDPVLNPIPSPVTPH